MIPRTSKFLCLSHKLEKYSQPPLFGLVNNHFKQRRVSILARIFAGNNVSVTFLKKTLVTTTGCGSLNDVPLLKGVWPTADSGQIDLKVEWICSFPVQ
jgi:hypothetical protein